MKTFTVALFSCIVAVALGAKSFSIRERILNGFDSSITVAPYQLSFQFGDHVCGASLIAPNRALTAASCYIPTSPLHKWFVVAGSTNNFAVDKTGIVSRVYAFVAHLEYDARTKNNDIAVIWLEDEFPLSKHIGVIALPKQDQRVPLGSFGIVSGWGKTHKKQLSDNLQSINVKFDHYTNCHSKQFGIITDKMICGASHTGENNVCQGDEGSALVLDGVQLGIVSRTGDCEANSYKAVYTRVSSYVDWINSVLTE